MPKKSNSDQPFDQMKYIQDWKKQSLRLKQRNSQLRETVAGLSLFIVALFPFFFINRTSYVAIMLNAQ